MLIDVLTLFPAMFESVLEASILGRARRQQRVRVDLHDFRAFATDKHRTVDDKPYGGGPGMVLKAQPILDCLRSIGVPITSSPEPSPAAGPHDPEAIAWPPGRRAGTVADPRIVLMTPQGEPLSQGRLQEWAGCERIVLLCGHYEGFDDRLRTILRPEEVSIGDYVLTGGELAAMVAIDGISRLLPGVLGHDASAEFESFDAGNDGSLDYPVYTKPLEVEGLGVPEVLRSGNHEAVAKWRVQQAAARTRQRRPDLLDDAAAGHDRAQQMAEVSRRPRAGSGPEPMPPQMPPPPE